MMTEAHRPLRLILDGDALVHNWRTLAKASGSATTGAAVKADGYGLGAIEVVKRLSAAGCRDFFVANWAEAAQLSTIVPAGQICVLNGAGESDLEFAKKLGAIPVLNTPTQVMRWRNAKGGRCHVMLDSGINRLGVGPEQLTAELLNGLDIDILMSHLASADENVPQNPTQLNLFRQMSTAISCRRRSIANSAGIQIGSDYHFDLTRPGIALYGGIVRNELSCDLRQVVRMEAQLLQVRKLSRGSSVGYNAAYSCKSDMRVGTIAIGYADGYLRDFSNKGSCSVGDATLPVIGRVSMDLVTLDLSASAEIAEGNWVKVDYDLAVASQASGISQYELLTGLGDRFERTWL